MQICTSEGGVDGTPFPPSIMLRFCIWFLPCYDVNIMGYIYKWCCWGTSDVIQHGRPFFQILHFFHYYFWHVKRTVVMKLNSPQPHITCSLICPISVSQIWPKWQQICVQEKETATKVDSCPDKSLLIQPPPPPIFLV